MHSPCPPLLSAGAWLGFFSHGETMHVTKYASPPYTTPDASDMTWAEVGEMLMSYQTLNCAPCQGHKCVHKGSAGAWSPVRLTPGTHRAAVNVQAVTALVLDVDGVTPEQWATASATLEARDIAHVVHSTHAHQDKSFFLRLIVAVDREISPGEFPSVRANFVNALGIPADPRAADISRIYYRPTQPRGGVEPLAYVYDGKPVTVSEFAHVAPQTATVPGRVAPLSADECKAEFLPASLELLNHVAQYLQRHGPAIEGQGGDRHTMIAGAVLLHDFALSEGEAWTLARDWNLSCVPPWDEKELATKLENGRKYAQGEYGEKRRDWALNQLLWKLHVSKFGTPANTNGRGGTIPTDHEEGDPEAWQEAISYETIKGAEFIRKNGLNAYTILTRHPEWAGVIRLNLMSRDIEFWGGPVVRDSEVQTLTDPLITRVQNWLEALPRPLSLPTNTIFDQIRNIADENPYDALGDYLRSLTWDGTPRLSSMLETYFHAATVIDGEDLTEYVGAVSSKWMIAAVARAFQPGCKVDNVLVLEGKQGLGKSRALGILGGEWFSDSPMEIGSKEAMMIAAKNWVIELAELDALRKHESTRIKAFFTQQFDEYRPPYGRTMVTTERRCVFAGTCNTSDYLRDDTGNRRFWPVLCTNAIDIEGLQRDRDQLWAEARVRYEAGEVWYLQGELTKRAEEQTEQRTVYDEREVRVLEWWLRKGKPEFFTSTDVIEGVFNIPASQINRAVQSDIGRVINRAGFEPSRLKHGERKRVRGYMAPPALMAIDTKERLLRHVDATAGQAVAAAHNKVGQA